MRFACALLMGLDAKNVDTTNVDCTIQTTRCVCFVCVFFFVGVITLEHFFKLLYV